jgi:hypothetical protein
MEPIMRRNMLCRALHVGLCLLAPFAWTATEERTPLPALPLEANKFAESLRVEIPRIAQQYWEAIASLPATHSNQMVALQKKLQDAGDLDGYLAVNQEIKRFCDAIKAEPDPFEDISEMPKSALVELPDALRAMQDQYIKAYKDKGDLRNKNLEGLYRNYITQLETLKTDLTIKGRIPEAVIVKKEAERLRKGMEEKTLIPQILATLPVRPRLAITPLPAGPIEAPTSVTNIPAYGRMPDWAKWQFDRVANCTADASLFAHPDLPDQLTFDFSAKTGRGRITGRCEVERSEINMRECTWFGKAIQWKVKDFTTLNATIVLQSKEISPGKGYGPRAHLVLLADKGPLGEWLEVPLMWKDVTLTLAKDPAANRCTLGWVQGKIKKVVDLPARGSVRVLLGLSVRNLGERCDTTLSLQ